MNLYLPEATEGPAPDLSPVLSRNGHLLRETERPAAAMRAQESIGLCVAPSYKNEGTWIAYKHKTSPDMPTGDTAYGDSAVAAVEDRLRRNPQPEDER